MLCDLLHLLINIVSLSDIANSLRTASGMTVCFTYCVYCTVYACMCYPCPSCRHTTAASRSSQSLLQMVPHTPFKYTSTVPSNLDLPPCSRKEPANTHKKWVKLECCWPSLFRQGIKVNVLQTIGSAGLRNFDKCAHYKCSHSYAARKH